MASKSPAKLARLQLLVGFPAERGLFEADPEYRRFPQLRSIDRVIGTLQSRGRTPCCHRKTRGDVVTKRQNSIYSSFTIDWSFQ